MMDYFKKSKNILDKIKNIKKSKKDYKFVMCKNCKKLHTEEELVKDYYICPKCNEYMYMPYKDRLNMIFDNYKIIDINIEYNNPIDFPGYKEVLEKNREKTGLKESVIVAKGEIKNNPCYVFILDPAFLMGSMGRNTGHIIAKVFNMANKDNLPVVSFSASGGARMQEGIFSLVQMANTVFALNEHGEKNLYISVLTNPTYGGVSASFASLGDIVIAEKNAKIGFTGQRVIEQTIRKQLPKDFQSADFQMEHGFIDEVVDRKLLKGYIGKLLEYHR